MWVKSLWSSQPSGRWTWLSLALCYAVFFILWGALSKSLYNGSIESFPTRLDVTLSLWLHEPPGEHWFMFFLSQEHAINRVPYANMPYLYSFFYAAYHLVINLLTFNRWPFATTYILTMGAMFASSWYILRPIIAQFSVRSCFLVLGLAAGTIVTSPYVTGYLLQFNHDTSFAFNAIAATVLAVAIWRDDGRKGAAVWVALIYCCISGWLGLVTIGVCFVARRRLHLGGVFWGALFAVNILNTLFPHLVAQLVFGETSASGLLFRTGFDGATDYFTDHWQALLAPYRPRSLERELSIKFLVLCVLSATALWRFRVNLSRETTAIGVALLTYLSHWIAFPQSISIHPYLYDMLFLIPLDIGLVIVMANVLGRLRNVTADMNSVVVFAVVSLLLHSNLLLLAQGRGIGD